MRKATKTKRSRASDDLLPEYDFSNGVRGKHATRYAEGTNVVLLDADVAELFPTSTSVNDALRELAKIARRAQAKPRRRRKSA
jgi:hypothetical protein